MPHTENDPAWSERGPESDATLISRFNAMRHSEEPTAAQAYYAFRIVEHFLPHVRRALLRFSHHLPLLRQELQANPRFSRVALDSLAWSPLSPESRHSAFDEVDVKKTNREIRAFLFYGDFTSALRRYVDESNLGTERKQIDSTVRTLTSGDAERRSKLVVDDAQAMAHRIIEEECDLSPRVPNLTARDAVLAFIRAGRRSGERGTNALCKNLRELGYSIAWGAGDNLFSSIRTYLKDRIQEACPGLPEGLREGEVTTWLQVLEYELDQHQ